jgi:hypothetical protein
MLILPPPNPDCSLQVRIPRHRRLIIGYQRDCEVPVPDIHEGECMWYEANTVRPERKRREHVGP